jgi:hypothetical protein
MADKTKEPKQGHPPVALPANSFEFSELEQKLDAAVKAKGDKGGPAAIDQAVRDSAQLPEVIEGQERPGLPEGTELKTIETQGGQTVEAPVSKPADAKSGEEATAQEIPPTAERTSAADGGEAAPK